jgi:dienelactone hydrolase
MKLADVKYHLLENGDNGADGYYRTESQIFDYLLNKVKAKEIEDENEKATITTTEEFEKQRAKKRQILIDAIGGLNYEKCELNPVITKTTEFDDFFVKNLYFQTIKDVYMTANLYVPKNGKFPCPALLMTCGHDTKGKNSPGYQKIALELVESGVAVLVVDPIGQGERHYFDKLNDDGKLLVGTPVQNHMYTALPLNLIGKNFMSFMIYELTRAIDYLFTLDFIDKEKIALTGNSGGGTQTCMTMLIEDRICSAMPCCYTSGRVEYAKTGQPQDSEQIVYGLIEDKVNYDDFITGIAPKPVAIGAARYDFFCVEGAERTYEKAKKIYALYGKEDNLSFTIANHVHGVRADMLYNNVNFFRKVLLGLENKDTNYNRTTLDDQTLNVTKDGFIIHEQISGQKTPMQVIKEMYEKEKYTDCDITELKERVKTVLGLPALTEKRPQIKYPRVVFDQTDGNQRTRRIFFFTENDIICTATLIENLSINNGSCTVYVSDNTTLEVENNKADIEKLLDTGAVLLFDVRGSGSVPFRDYNYSHGTSLGMFINTYYIHNCYAKMFKTSMYAYRVFDIVRATDLLRDYFGYNTINICGKDFSNLYTLSASVITGDKAIVSGELPKISEVFDKAYYHITPNVDIHGILKYYDVPLLVKNLNPIKL